ncbi:Glucosaminyl phosphatidylinositol (GlcN-PI) nositol acylation protein [Microbotryomycetes sp. JL201]|nr:Glucosaminyl phosphatidylinositol (GlcN-PI) nositol acylation protein [Microbotryomycetes sp. JL201]
MVEHAAANAAATYKHQKELFVSHSAGSSIWYINAVCLTAATTYAWWTIAQPRLRTRHHSAPSSWRTPQLEFALLVWPLLAALTIASRHPLLLNAIIVSLTYATAQVALPPASPPLSPTQSRNQSPTTPDSPYFREKHVRPTLASTSTSFSSSTSAPRAFSSTLFTKPFVTVYRAHMMLMTAICILAVDFKVFPRQFAKAETWGTSLMDLGVGSFVFSLGLISALSLLRTTDRTPLLNATWKVVKKSFGVIILGVVRVIMVKGVDYPEHLSEYGTHWNFFFTLGLLPVFGVAFERLSPRVDFHLMALAVSGGEKDTLRRDGQRTIWALDAARTTIWSHNKEGLVSLPGYLAIFLLGTGTGLYTLPPDPSFYQIIHQRLPRTSTPEQRQKFSDKQRKIWQMKPGKLANVLGSYAVLWWVLYGGLRWLGLPVSRRIANLPYVVWTAAFNTSFLFLYMSIHMWSTHSPTTRATTAPATFDAINRNSLVVFLIANVLTGLVNVSIKSMYASTTVAMTVLVAYCAAVVGSAWLLREKRLRI